MIINSKRKSIVCFNKKQSAHFKIDSQQSWSYAGTSKNLGEKYKIRNCKLNDSNYQVNKAHRVGYDLDDV